MSVHTFTLVLSHPQTLTPELEDAVFEAGCDDAALGRRSGALYLEFDRAAPCLLDAVLSAIQDVRRVPGAVVAHVEPADIVSASEIAHRVGRSRESVRLLVEGARGPGGFPPPLAGVRAKRFPLWRWSDVAEWLETYGIETGRTDEARVIAAVNGALDLVAHSDSDHRNAILEAVGNGS